MTKLLVQYTTKSLAALQSRLDHQNNVLPWEFDFTGISNIHVILQDLLGITDGLKLHLGLLVTLDLEYENFNGALEISKDITESILNLVTFAAKASCGAAEVRSYVNLTDKKIKSFGYPFSSDNPLGSLSILKEDRFREVFDKFQRSTNQQRIMRAMSWLRKGINEDNFIDEFVSYFVGLEVLASLLQRKLKMKMKDPGSWEGIKQIFDKINVVNFDDVNTARNELLHGFKTLDNAFVERMGSYVEPVRTALFMALGEALEIGQVIINEILAKPLRRQRIQPWIAIEADFDNPRGIAERDLLMNFPQIYPEITGSAYSLNENGNLDISTQIKHHFIGSEGITWNNMAFEQWGDADSGITKSEVKLDE